MTDEPAQQASLRASDADRQNAVERLEKGLAEGRITAEEFQQRAQAAHAATTTAALRPLLADLPEHAPAAEIVGRRGPESVFNVFGDVRLSGRTQPPRRIGVVLGNIRLALRADADVVELELWTVLGDVDVVLAEGVEGELDGWAVLGNRRLELAPVPRTPGTPRVVVRAHAVLGNLRLRSLPPGAPVSRWRRRRL